MTAEGRPGTGPTKPRQSGQPHALIPLAHWLLRYWKWLAPVALLAALLILTPLLLGAERPPMLQLSLSALALGLLTLAIWQLQRWSVATEMLERALRDIGQGRLETSTARDIPAPLRPMGQQIDALGRQLIQQRDQFESRMQSANVRLRQDLESVQDRLRETEQALAQLQQETKTQSEQFSGLTHELRTPLTAILGFSDLLRKTRLDTDQGDYLATLDRSARGLLAMLNDVLDWSRIEAGRLSLNIERFDVADAVEDVISLLAPLAYEKQLELIHIVDHDVPPQLEGDAQRLRQILTNLLSNAIKFTDSGEVVLRVSREREQHSQVWLRIAVRDTGVGLSAEQRQRVFQRFEQVSDAQADARGRQPGSGLGLNIVQHLAGLMEGQVEVESESGVGSTFSALLALGKVRSELPRRDRLRGRSLWICDTEPSAERALLHYLQFWGAEITRCDDIDQLVSRLRLSTPQQRPAAVIAGIRPQALTSAALKALGELCIDAHPPLLLMLSSASPADQQRAIDIGAARAVPKSISRLQLYRELCDLSSDEPSRPLLQDQTLLVAENNLANRRYLVALGRELGAEVIEAGDGQEAIRCWRERQPDFALIDYRMPGQNGLDAIRAIRQAEGSNPSITRRTRLVATSAYLSADEHQLLRSAGADQVLIKPFDEAQLLRALDPDLAREHRGSGTAIRVAQDPELLALLREELPQQLRELEEAFARSDAIAARACAHTLNGTAAFYRLPALKAAASEMEIQLAASAFSGVGDGSLRRLRTAVLSSLAEISTAEPTAP